MPRLLWLVRDSAIEYKDERQEEISENQYLELKLSSLAADGSRKICNTREAIL